MSYYPQNPNGQATMANSSPVVLASNQSSIPVTGTFWQATQPVSLSSLPALATGSNTIGALTANQSVNLNQVGGSAYALGQQLAASSLPVVLTAAQLSSLTPTPLAPAGTALNTYSVHITTNTTTTPVASTAYISTITISNEVAGTTSNITIQDKQGTPLKLVNGLATTALTTAPTLLTWATPQKMVSGIDIITSGAVAATVDVWINYYQ